MADTIRTEADLKNNIFPDNQAAGSITAQDMRDLVASARYLQPLGWVFRFDSQYDDSNLPTSAMNLVDGVPQKITFTDNVGEDLRYPTTFPDVWNNTDQKFDISTFLNGFGIVRLSCVGQYSGSQPHLDLFIDAGSDPIAPAGGGTASNIIYTESCVFAKLSSTPQAFNWIIPLFGGTDFVANGAQFIIQSHGGNADLWQFTLTAAATLVANPAGEG